MTAVRQPPSLASKLSFWDLISSNLLFSCSFLTGSTSSDLSCFSGFRLSRLYTQRHKQTLKKVVRKTKITEQMRSLEEATQTPQGWVALRSLHLASLTILQIGLWGMWSACGSVFAQKQLDQGRHDMRRTEAQRASGVILFVLQQLRLKIKWLAHLWQILMWKYRLDCSSHNNKFYWMISSLKNNCDKLQYCNFTITMA